MNQAVCIVIIQNNKVLSVARRDNHSDFGLPGGKLEDGESFEQAACRELFEETKLTVLPNDLSFIFEDTCGEYLVKTFLAKEWSGNLEQGDTGPVQWVRTTNLINGSFGKYNKALFESMPNLFSKKEDIKLNNLTFKYSSVLESIYEGGGYYIDFGEYQIQIISDRDGHWHMSIPFIEMETESHSPEDSVKLGYDFLKEIAKGINES